jgi:hypothetical protein
MVLVIHGDDFIVVGRDADLKWIAEELGNKILLKKVGVLGGGPNDVREMRVLNRVLRWESWGIAYEADPRHAELLIQALGDRAQSRVAPGVKSGSGPTADSDPLPWDAVRLFRACAARANYLGLDRVDVAFGALSKDERANMGRPRGPSTSGSILGRLTSLSSAVPVARGI